jgi:methylthioribose-1-phosphate isomerase
LSAGASRAERGGVIGPVRWGGGVLEILDQRRLPADEVWLRCESWQQVAEAIRTLAVRGAPAIGIAAAFGLALAADRTEAALGLKAARPTAVNLAWAVDRALGSGDPLREAEAIAAEEAARCDAIATAGAELVAAGARALTVCHTGALATGGVGTALGVLVHAFGAGRLREVVACETRPLLQGARLTMWECMQLGVPARLIVDGAAAQAMRRGEVDLVIAGADRIAANGDTANKIGTYGLAVLARHHGLPFYIAAPTSTVDPATPDGGAIPIEERDPSEVLRIGAPAGARASNPAFDVTPAELITAWITERGVTRTPPGTGPTASQMAN